VEYTAATAEALAGPSRADRLADLEARVATLEAEFASMRAALADLLDPGT
jgi:uncharacterized protein YceH (UPF0502 family)